MNWQSRVPGRSASGIGPGVVDLQRLVVVDARLDERRRDVDHQPEPREPTASLEPAAEIAWQPDPLRVSPWQVSPGISTK